MELTNSQKGKLAEFLVFRKLVEEGADLYLPAIDTGIDAVIKKKDGIYIEIQVKSTTAKAQAGCFNVYDLEDRDPKKFMRYVLTCLLTLLKLGFSKMKTSRNMRLLL